MDTLREWPILLVDDEAAFLQSLSLTLKRNGLTSIVQCHDSRQVAELLEQQNFSVAIFDLMMPYLSGDQLLEQVARSNPDLPVIILTGMNQVEQAVKCMKLGAFDFFIKTGESERLIAGIQRALKQRQMQQEFDRLKERMLSDKPRHPEAFADILTSSRKMTDIFRYIEAVATSPEPLLITGESGVGKEMFAHAVHKLSAAGGPWVAVNVAGLDDNVFSDTLFGHVRGAFTGADRARTGMIEQAVGGVLFLDEIGDLSLESQVKLLRLLQEREYFPLGSDTPKTADTKIIVATNVSLEEHLENGAFRKDLYYRLRTHQVEIPPLRERREDLPLLLDHFLTEAARSMNKKKPTPPAELSILLSQYSFPGNVRELRGMVYDAVGQHQAKKLSMATFEKAIGLNAAPTVAAQPGTLPGTGVTFHEQLPTLKQAADLLVREALERTGGNQSLAAKLLGITQPSLSSRLKKLKA